MRTGTYYMVAPCLHIIANRVRGFGVGGARKGLSATSASFLRSEPASRLWVGHCDLAG